MLTTLTSLLTFCALRCGSNQVCADAEQSQSLGSSFLLGADEEFDPIGEVVAKGNNVLHGQHACGAITV